MLSNIFFLKSLEVSSIFSTIVLLFRLNKMFEKTNTSRSADIRILTHHIYEYKKGLRLLALHTIAASERKEAERILGRREIPYFIQEVSSQKINIFMGDANCIKTIQSFGKESLNQYTPEQDFMLGIMLGYDRKQQFERYLDFTRKKEAIR